MALSFGYQIPHNKKQHDGDCGERNSSAAAGDTSSVSYEVLFLKKQYYVVKR